MKKELTDETLIVIDFMGALSIMAYKRYKLNGLKHQFYLYTAQKNFGEIDSKGHIIVKERDYV